MPSRNRRPWMAILALACAPEPFAPGGIPAGSARIDAPTVLSTPVAAVGDLDGDGDLDEVVFGPTTGLLQPLLNDGLGGFLPGTAFVQPTLNLGTGGTGSGDYALAANGTGSR